MSCFGEQGIPSARIRSHHDVVNDPHLIARGSLAPLDVPEVGRVLVQTAPHPMTGADVLPRTAPPHIGEHTSEVLETVLALDRSSVQQLIDKDVVRTWTKES